MLIAAALLAATTARAQVPRDDSAAPLRTVRGRVLSDDGTPLPRVHLAVAPAGRESETDNSGQFEVAVPSARPQTVTAFKTGYLTTTTSLADGMVTRLAKAAVITGWVTDDVGGAWPTMAVVAERRVVTNGQVQFERQASGETDDLGVYRLFGLPAGDYVIGIAGSRAPLPGSMSVIVPGPPAGPVRTYYPNAQSATDAQVLTVRAGGEVSGIAFIVGGPSPSAIGTPPTVVRAGEGGAIRGTVFGVDGFPSRHARVTLTSADRLFTPFFTPSTETGTYEFLGVPAGRYMISAVAPPFVSAAFGQRRPGDRGAIVTLARGDVADHIDILMPRTSAIVGRIVDASGDPIERANVRIDRIQWSRGRRRLLAVDGVSSRRTDDTGAFRIFGVPPGRYLVSAIETDAQDPTVPREMRTYFPGTSSSSRATIVDVADDQDQVIAEFPIVRDAGLRVSGRAIGPDGRPFTGAVYLIPSARSGALSPAEPFRMRTDDGTFAFNHLAAGEYVLQAALAREGTSVEGASASLFLNIGTQNLGDVQLRLSTGSSVRGRFTFDGDATGLDPSDIELDAAPGDEDVVSLAGNPVARANVQADWSFEMHGLNDRRRLEVLKPPKGWMLKAIYLDGREITDEALPFGTDAESISNVEVAFTSRPTQISGIVVAARNRPAPDSTVILFADDPARWYLQSRFVRSADVAGDGTFTLTDPAPGDYRIVAIDSRDVPDVRDQLDNHGFLEGVTPRASRVTVTDGGRTAITLRAP